MKYFQSVTNLEELKKQYRKLSLELHPDRKGGNEKAFIEMKAEYDRLFKHLEKGEEHAAAFTDIIDALSKYDLDIEIIGTWVWVAGNTFTIKSELKELGFKWAGKKKMWYWHSGEYTRKNKKQFSISEIREMHGTEKIKSASNQKQIG